MFFGPAADFTEPGVTVRFPVDETEDEEMAFEPGVEAALIPGVICRGLLEGATDGEPPWEAEAEIMERANK